MEELPSLPGPGLPRRLQEHRGAQDVHLDEGEGGRVLLARRVPGGEVHHRIETALRKEPVEERLIRDAPPHEAVAPGILLLEALKDRDVLPPAEVVEDGDVPVPALSEDHSDEVPAHEAATPGHQRPDGGALGRPQGPDCRLRGAFRRQARTLWWARRLSAHASVP